MTREELHSLGLSDAKLARAYREATGRPARIPRTDGSEAKLRRRRVFDAVTRVWAGLPPQPEAFPFAGIGPKGGYYDLFTGEGVREQFVDDEKG